MENERPPAAPSHTVAGDGEEPATAVSQESRRWTTQTVVVAILLPLGAISAVAAVWLVTVRAAPRAQQSQVTQTTASTSAPRTGPIKSQAWDQAHLGASGMEKCGAFREVLRRTAEIQGTGSGQMSPVEGAALEAQLNTAKAMPPAAVTPAQCGVPLG